MASTASASDIQAFISKWEISGAAERANAQSFIKELCRLLEVDEPQPKTANEAANAYVFEKTIPGAAGSSNFIDCYKRGCFVLESKQGSDAVGFAGSRHASTQQTFSAEAEQQHRSRKTGHGIRNTKGWDTAMEKARAQAENYVRRLPKEEIADGRPPFIMVVDVGHSIALDTDWSRAGGYYAPFPDPTSYRIQLKDLLRPEVREQLRAIWNDPLSLDPSRRSAKVTRDIAKSLAELAKSLEQKHDAEHVANFLMRCLFTMFSEDVDLLPFGSFTKLLGELKQAPETFAPAMHSLWTSMNIGGVSPVLKKHLPRFNGGLFAKADAIPLNADQIQLLIEAATANWKEVEPAIFGTLLERALDARERHKLGAHYTPRAYVVRLVEPTVIAPMREEWMAVQVAALQHHKEGKTNKAIDEVRGFMHRLANVRILDPACGSGNFLCVTLELLKRLEGEVLNTLRDLGEDQHKLELEGVMVRPENFAGIEVNPRAAAIADLVLWIGFLQWHLRSHGDLHHLPEPIIKNLHNIECRDAVLTWTDRTPLLDDDGKPVTRWDGVTTMKHSVTGEQVPDPTARVQAYHYHNPKPATWPKADYIVGNPPFIGNKRMRAALGDGYAEALRGAYPNLSATVDFVMYWWEKAAHLISQGKTKRFGFITTNSITQPFNRVVIEEHFQSKKPMSLAFAISDHPWVDSTDGAAVRIAMTVGTMGKVDGVVARVVSETESHDGGVDVVLETAGGKVHPDLETGSDVTSASDLKANSILSGQGVIVLGDGFQLEESEFEELRRSEPKGMRLVKRYLNGKDLMHRARGLRIIDLFGMTEKEVQAYPFIYQRIYDRVRPARLEMKDRARREKWWLFGRSNNTIWNIKDVQC